MTILLVTPKATNLNWKTQVDLMLLAEVDENTGKFQIFEFVWNGSPTFEIWGSRSARPHTCVGRIDHQGQQS